MSTEVLKAVRTRQRVLESTVQRWVLAIQDDTESRGPLVLPLRDLSGSLLDFYSLVEEFPEVLARAEGEEAQISIRNRLAAIGGELTASHGTLRDSLSTLATESATARTLIVNGDLFDISAFGCLVMAGLSNLLCLAFGKKASSKREPVEPDPALVEEPLDLAIARGAKRPGDLWLADLAARTAIAAGTELGRSNPKRTAWLQKVLPKFVAVSLLYKLTAVTKFGPAIAKKADYKLWPGLDVLLDEPGARPARAVLVGELANGLCGQNAGLAQVALFRFLTALAAVEGPARTLAGRNLAATLFWEILELDPKALGRMVDLGTPASPLLDAIEATDAASRGVAPQNLNEEHARLDEACVCLRTFPEFTALLALRRGLVSNRSTI